MSSPAPYLPRRSSRLGPKRWAAHFAKVGRTYNETGMTFFLNMYLTRYMEPFDKSRLRKMYITNKFTEKCYYMNSIYESLLLHPGFLLDNPTFWEDFYKKAQEFLTTESIQKSKKYWAVKLKETLCDFFQMCEYLPLCM